MTVDLGYFSTTRPDSLAAALGGADTILTLTDGSSFPDPAVGGKPYTVIVGYGSSREEVCTVTAKPTTNTLTLLRGQDGTAPTAKNIGDVVVHGVSAREFNALVNKLDASGDTMTGALVLAGDPAQPLEAATKGYVDANRGWTRQAFRITADTIAGSAARTDYIYVCANSTTLNLQLPTALGNTCRYTVKLVGAGDVWVKATTGQWFDMTVGSNLHLTVPLQSVDIVSSGNTAQPTWVII